MTIRALIVDDEPLARRRLRAFLREEPDVQIAAECRNGEEALRSIRTLRPDLVFLDVEMPGLDGFGLLQTLEESPWIVFVTAHDQYAVRAFEARAVDYLLKPFSRDRFRDTLDRVRALFDSTAGTEVRKRMLQILREMTAPAAARPLPRLAIRTGTRTVVLDPARIEWIEAEGDYVRIHAGRETHLTRQTLNRMEAELPGGRFVRVHRSALVNIQYLKEIHPMPAGDHALVLQDGTRLTLSRGYRERLDRALGGGIAAD